MIRRLFRNFSSDREQMTALGKQLAAGIKSSGPMSVSQFMRSCLVHPVHGYYMTRDVFGTRGDFVTSPEISQLFGEMVGVFVALVAEKKFRIVEMGPGRGTLMKDILTALKMFKITPSEVNLIDASPFLVTSQKELLKDFGNISWNSILKDVPNDMFTIYLGHEFLDALPINQYIFKNKVFSELEVNLVHDSEQHFGLGVNRSESDVDSRRYADAAEGDIIQTSPDSVRITAEISQRIKDTGGLAIFIDYGQDKITSNTLRGIKDHAFISPFAMPGMIDLSADVEFDAIKETALSRGN